MSEGMYLIDPESGEEEFYTWDELAELGEDVHRAAIAPVEGSGFIYGAEAFTALPLANIPFYVQDWLPMRGKMRLSAPAKAGKSTLALQMARSLGSGVSFLGRDVTQGRALYIQSELSPPTLQRRLRDTGLGYPDVFVGTSFGLKIDSSAGEELLANAILAVHPNVLILDPLYKMMSGDENETHDAMVIVDTLDRLIDIAPDDMSILIIHHMGKDEKKGGRGSTVFEDWVDSDVEMRRTSAPDEPLRVKITAPRLRHAAPAEEPIRAEWVMGEFELSDIVETLSQRLLAALHSGPKRIAELIQVTSASRAGVNKALAGLKEKGIVHVPERGLYALAQEEVKV